MSIVITGTSGFIGLNLLGKLLYNTTEDIIVICRNMDSINKIKNAVNNYNIKYIIANLSNHNDIQYIKHIICDEFYLFHLGAYIISNINESNTYNTLQSIQDNIYSSVNLLLNFKKQIRGVCYTSTLDVYGIPNQIITEEHTLNPLTAYAISKLSTEFYFQQECKNIPLSILRLSHVYGQKDTHKKVLQSFIDTVKRGQNITIYGDGTDLRDYIYIDDVVKVILSCYYRQINGLFNVASGKSYSLTTIAQMVIKHYNTTSGISYINSDYAKKDYIFNINKLRNTFSNINIRDLETIMENVLCKMG